MSYGFIYITFFSDSALKIKTHVNDSLRQKDSGEGIWVFFGKSPV